MTQITSLRKGGKAHAPLGSPSGKFGAEKVRCSSAEAQREDETMLNSWTAVTLFPQLLLVAFSCLGCSEAELQASSPLAPSVLIGAASSGTRRSGHDGQKGTQQLYVLMMRATVKA